MEDINELYELYKSKKVTRYMEGLYDDYEEEYNYMSAYIKNMYGFYGYGIWIVVRKEDNKIIGRVGLSNREVDGETKLELGYVIGEEYQNKGYAYEACVGVCEFVKRKLYEEEIVCFIKEGNDASIALAKKLGFEFVDNAVSEGETYIYYKVNLNKNKRY